MQLTPEQINTFIADAVLQSQIGEAVKQSVARSVSELSKTYNNPFDEVIKRHVTQLIDAEVMTTYRPVLEAGIKDALARYMTDDVLTTIVETALTKLRNSRY
jgi:3-methyladenine DNA glycosylase AlkC